MWPGSHAQVRANIKIAALAVANGGRKKLCASVVVAQTAVDLSRFDKKKKDN